MASADVRRASTVLFSHQARRDGWWVHDRRLSRRGREFREASKPDRSPVCAVIRTTAARMFPESPSYGLEVLRSGQVMQTSLREEPGPIA